MSTPFTETEDQAPKRWQRWKGWIGFVLGVVLLVAAGVIIVASPGLIEQLWTNLRHAPRWSIAIIIAGPVVSWVFVGLCLHLLMRRHGFIGRFEMLMLVGSAWMLNYLPMRPGLVGRVGYHKAINGIRVRDSVEATVWSLIFSVVSNIIVIALVLVVPIDIATPNLIGMLCAPVLIFGVLGAIVQSRSLNMGRLTIALALRYADVLIWLVRYAAVFAAIGIDANATQIAMIAAVSQFTHLIPITGSGLGFREWGVGITARQGGHAMQAAIGADLINRAIETLWVFPIGFFSTWWIAKSVRRHTQENAQEPVVIDTEQSNKDE